MRNKRLCPASAIVILAVMTTAPASAAGFGAAGQAAVLGQPLDFTVPLRLDAGEAVAPACVDAEVTFGERRLPAAQVRTRIEAQGADGARIRVLTAPAVDEPVIGVTLGLGCQARQSRHYVVLADPPPPAVATAAVVTAPAFARAPAGDEWLAASMPAAAAPPSAATRTVARPERRSQRSSPVRARVPVPRPQRMVAFATESPRLRLDLAEPPPGADAAAVEMALQAVAQAASAAWASAARIAALEHTVERLGREAVANRDEAAQLREQLARARVDGVDRWMWPLLFAGMLLAALSGWLAWRLSNLQRERRHDWLAAMSQPQPEGNGAGATPEPATAPTPFATPERRPAAAATAARAQLGAGGESAPTGSDAGPASQLGPATEFRADIATARDVSIEELIDLEQQADFFVVLGQDEAAIDLLMQHLRDTGGGSPLPYLKLLEIHHRRGDRLPYERMRQSFNHRFNAFAPAWEVDPGGGRSLEDYPGVLPRLQQVWPRPLDAMAELEALLFRRSRGELFDLPAYREVLFLYALARDRLDRDAVEPRLVDLLLPLADGGEYGSTVPTPLFDLADGGGAAAGADADGGERAAVDLDLTQAARPTSIFDLLPSTAPGPRA